jgi:hypothetical protein
LTFNECAYYPQFSRKQQVHDALKATHYISFTTPHIFLQLFLNLLVNYPSYFSAHKSFSNFQCFNFAQINHSTFFFEVFAGASM